ncbi:hypothetical protein [Hymenobacter volaticus]|uniref:Uncharacterized protein n=1 Tax=Hymenobacter volaticus TaxID=2932254 RepID=A0ABY4G765_9BACT|nr:hypothetical protein [Hymenobacter volaticus]UOQ66626.1 hypothetical protein MUN86_01455 [Hymenobacter volaticus]
MKKEPQYTVCCQLTIAEVELGRIIETRQVNHHLSTETTELNELFADLYEQFRSPYLLGLQITAIHGHEPCPATTDVIQ